MGNARVRDTISAPITPNSKPFRLINVPFYYIGQIDKIIGMYADGNEPGLVHYHLFV